MRDDSPAVPPGPITQPGQGISSLDMATFHQLIMAIQQSGLSLNVDAIHSVSDRDFREGRYQRAFDVIEGVFLQMNAQVGRRQSQLRQQEMQYKSGALKMSPKEWMARQRRETDKTQRIERARRHCARILDGLNALRALQAEQTPPKPETPPPDEPSQEQRS
jgi:hypothetical protein